MNPSLDWLNDIVATMWLNWRALARFKFLNSIWPKIKKKLQNTQFKNLRIHDFSIGDKPFQITHVDFIDHSQDCALLDLEVNYHGSASITLTYSQDSLNISIPMTVRNFSVTNIKPRLVIKNMKSTLPFIEGVQIFFLESPIINWETADAARVIDITGLDNVIKSIIEKQVIKRFVHPNRLSLPVTLPVSYQKELYDLNLSYFEPDIHHIAMPVPTGVIRVKVVKAEDLKMASIDWNPFKKSPFKNPIQAIQVLDLGFLATSWTRRFLHHCCHWKQSLQECHSEKDKQSRLEFFLRLLH